MKLFNVKPTTYRQVGINILFGLGIIGIITLIVFIVLLYKDYKEQERINGYPFEIMRQEAELAYNENKSQLVKIVDDYIQNSAPTSSLTGYCIVTNCEKYDLDIKFVLAQGQVESNFGTRGLATKTNSVFNVGAYDGKTYEEINGKFKYKHPDFSVEPYMQLLYKDYITGTKTELDLMKKYVNKGGKRYASNENYENDVLNIYQQIEELTNISELQGEMKRYKIILGK